MTTTSRALPIAAAAMATLVALAVAGCTTEQTDDVDTAHARPVTTEEAQALAMTRVRNLEAGTRSIAFEVDDRGEAVAFDGWFDYATGTGYGLLTGDNTGHLIVWNHTDIASTPWTGDTSDDTTPPPPPADGLDSAGDGESTWTSGPLDPASSGLHATLAVVAALGSDRPENPLLLQSSGALWLADRTLDDVDLTVIAGPPSDEALPPGETADPGAATVRYWIEDTGLAHRVDVRLGAGEEWTEIAFAPAEGVTVEDPFGAAQGSG